MQLQNTPRVKLGIVAVSRDCFPKSLARRRLEELAAAVAAGSSLVPLCSSVVVESEKDALAARDELVAGGCNAAVIFLGNFGPEGPTAILAEQFPGPVMVCAAAEENEEVLAADRGDALCGMLNCSYNLNLRSVPAYIPQMPVGTAVELVDKIVDFDSIARVVIGVAGLKIFGFGPRPQDFFACNAPLQPLYDLGIEVMENSELDLRQCYRKAASRSREIKAVAADMKKELGAGCKYFDLLPELARFEVALLDFMSDNLGSRQYGVFANKCWPAFEETFGFVPCYVNSRLAGRGIPVACEVDLYGALSEYCLQLASLSAATLLDINNSVPPRIVPPNTDLGGAVPEDLFMGFHCGNTCSAHLTECEMKYQLIMNRLMEDGKEPDITRGTLEGTLKPGPTTLFRIQGSADCRLLSYVAEGRILPVDPRTFGCAGVFAIPGFARFYRHVLIGQNFPHHGGVGFAAVGRCLFEAVKLMGIESIHFPLPAGMLYPGENPFETILSPK